jgi:tetratricopeptide (TPR) repeat protein
LHSPSPEPDRPILSGHLVVFTGKLSSLGRKDARALVAKLGGATADDVNARTTMLVIGSEGFQSARRAKEETQSAPVAPEAAGAAAALADDDAPGVPSNKLKRAEEINAERAVSGEAKIEVLTEEEFCRLTGVPTPEALKRQYHATRDLLARYRSLREDHLRYLVKYGIIRPVLRTNADTFYAFPDLSAIKQANDALERGMSFRNAVRALKPASSRQLTFDFKLDAEPAKILTLRRPPPPAAGVQRKEPMPGVRETALAEEYFRTGSILDERHADNEANLDDAAAAYRKALELDPYLVAALINLANIHYSRDELAEAQALYERAIGLEPDFFEAHFNLGNIYHDLGRFPEAQACYREALRLNARYADAHFYLAVTLEKMGLSPDALPHWRAYQQLAPNGEWVELAREFSE